MSTWRILFTFNSNSFNLNYLANYSVSGFRLLYNYLIFLPDTQIIASPVNSSFDQTKEIDRSIFLWLWEIGTFKNKNVVVLQGLLCTK